MALPNMDAATRKIVNLGDPTVDQDAATKKYVDDNIGGGGSPTGAAGGVLDGTYPNPGLAAGVAGAGLAETSDVLSVNVDGSTIEINTDTLRVKADGITANEIAAGAVGASELASTAVTPATYGDATHVAQVTVDADGRITGASGVAITGIGGVAADTIWDAKGDLAGGTGADTASRLAVGSNGKVLVAASGETTGLKWDYPPGYELDVATNATDLTVTATTAATAQAWLTGNSVTYDGTPVLLTWWCANLSGGSTAIYIAELYDGSTDQSLRIGQGNASLSGPASGFYRFTPSAAAHTYSIKLWRVNANVTAFGTGGGIYPPALLRVVKA